MKPRDLKDRLISLLEVDHLISANAIMEKFALSETSFNKSSVYRALDQLMENGAVCEHNFDGKETLYELRSHHHAHLYCSNCGSVSTGPCEYEQPQRVGSFTVDHHHLTLIGRCERCTS